MLDESCLRISSGFAIVRPPGHHAYGKVPQGYCVFNNVAIAAKYAVEHLGLERVCCFFAILFYSAKFRLPL